MEKAATVDSKSDLSNEMNDTIVALATPIGRSGIGVVRLSGAESLNITSKLVSDTSFSPLPRQAVLRSVWDVTGVEIDEALITFFKGPKSFTGEDVIEISCHGSPIVLRQIIDSCLTYGARLASPGEFSLRALGNGRINLAQAEAIRDLIEAQTVTAARQSLRQMKGDLSATIAPFSNELLNTIVVLESSLEFVEDDIPQFRNNAISESLTRLATDLDSLAATFSSGRLFRDGIAVVLVGRPNVGKSSLFNTLIGSERAIVTEIPGTTRDQIRETLIIKGVPVSLTDTAGIRATEDVVEVIGVERSKRIMSDADIILVVIDSSSQLTDGDTEILNQASQFEHLVIFNKSDLPACQDLKISSPCVKVSAKDGTGIEELKASIIHPFSKAVENPSGFLISDARHHDLLNRAAAEIRKSIETISNGESEEITLIGLHNSLRLLGQITGETTTEDMLTRIFSTFCIGK